MGLGGGTRGFGFFFCRGAEEKKKMGPGARAGTKGGRKGVRGAAKNMGGGGLYGGPKKKKQNKKLEGRHSLGARGARGGSKGDGLGGGGACFLCGETCFPRGGRGKSFVSPPFVGGGWTGNIITSRGQKV